MSPKPKSIINRTDLTRSQLAKVGNVGLEAIRFYEQQGLLFPAYRDSSNYRRYGQEEIECLSFINKAKQLGFTLPEIREFIDLRDVQTTNWQEPREKAELKLAAIDDRIRDLMHFKTPLTELVERCKQSESNKPCVIMEYLENRETKSNGQS